MIIDDKNINDEALEMILDLIELRNPDLRILSLNNNHITDKGLLILANFLPKFQNLRILYLSNVLRDLI